MARDQCNYGKPYDTKKACEKANPGMVATPCARCRGYHPKPDKRRKQSHKRY